MGWALKNGSGKAQFTDELAAFYAEASANLVRFGGESVNGPSPWRILKDLPPEMPGPPQNTTVCSTRFPVICKKTTP
jgi:hypothetical protein